MTGHTAWEIVCDRNPAQRFVRVVRALVGKAVAWQPGYARHRGPCGPVVDAHQNQQVVGKRAFQVPVGPEFQVHLTGEPGKIGREVKSSIGVVCVIPRHVAVKPRSRCITEVGEGEVVEEPALAKPRCGRGMETESDFKRCCRRWNHVVKSEVSLPPRTRGPRPNSGRGTCEGRSVGVGRRGDQHVPRSSRKTMFDPSCVVVVEVQPMVNAHVVLVDKGRNGLCG